MFHIVLSVAGRGGQKCTRCHHGGQFALDVTRWPIGTRCYHGGELALDITMVANWHSMLPLGRIGTRKGRNIKGGMGTSPPRGGQSDRLNNKRVMLIWRKSCFYIILMMLLVIFIHEMSLCCPVC